MRWRLGLRSRPRWGAYDALRNPLIRDGLRAFGAHNYSYVLAPHIILAQIYPPNSTFLESPMVLSNPPSHFLDTLCLVSGPSGPQLYGPPYLFFGNSTTDLQPVINTVCALWIHAQD